MKKILFIMMCALATASFTSAPVETATEIRNQEHFRFGKLSGKSTRAAEGKMKYIEFTTSCGIPVWAEYDTDYFTDSDVIDIMIYVDNYFCVD